MRLVYRSTFYVLIGFQGKGRGNLWGGISTVLMYRGDTESQLTDRTVHDLFRPGDVALHL